MEKLVFLHNFEFIIMVSVFSMILFQQKVPPVVIPILHKLTDKLTGKRKLMISRLNSKVSSRFLFSIFFLKIFAGNFLKKKILEEQKAREAKEKELEEVEKKAEDALETIKQLAADRDQLKEKIDELEKNINELIKLVQRHSDGELQWNAT